MVKRIQYIITVLLITLLFTSQTNAQQLSVYKITRMSFNSDAFSEISPVIVKDGIIFCSNRRFSAFKDRTAWDGSRLYNIYFTEKKIHLTGKAERVKKRAKFKV